MAAFENLQHLRAVVELRTAVVAQGGKVREGEQYVNLSHGQRTLADAARLGGDGLAQLGEEAALDFDNLLFGVEHLGLVLLQLGRGEALGTDESLLALIVGGRVLQVGLADLDVKAEDIVELDLQRIDARALALALLDLGNVTACCCG